MSSKRDEALALAARGFRVFPLNDRLPAIKRWPDLATTDPETITAWFESQFPSANVGVATGRGLFVVDADGPVGVASFGLLEEFGVEFGLIVETRSKGRHGYLLASDDQPVPNSVKRLKDFPGIDIRGDGGYVVAPGTAGYEVISDAA